MTLDDAYVTSGKIFERVSKLYRPTMLEELRSLESGEIVVVDGEHDSVEQLLETLRVPYDLIDAETMETHEGGRVWFVNCSSYNRGDQSQEKKLQEVVNGGGRVITTDWSLDLLTQAFPQRLKHTRDTEDDIVEVQCNNPLAQQLLGLHYAQCHPKWWLETASYVYDVVGAVTPILTSEEMQRKYGSPYVAVAFSEGRGEVFHFISHFVLQRTEARSAVDTLGLEDFLAKIGTTLDDVTADINVAELEAAYSTLNTVAQLCLRVPLLQTSGKSLVYHGRSKTVKSKSLL